ncbi:MAG: hypothetical protein LBC52_06755 [Treponema sp.]|jgi:hypothetical protein|nr:hypothetical protein [Treponema sp.]
MKRFIIFILVMGIAMPIFAQAKIPEYTFASGSWRFTGPRLYQNDANAKLAKVNFKAPQSGIMLYEFNVRYEGGAEDGHGGLGIHIFVDNALNRASWGAGKSWLLWLNYDEKPLSKNIPTGLSAQIYRSISNSRMELIHSFPLTSYERYLTEENLASPITFRIIANGDTGEIRVYDPTDPNNRKYFYFYIDNKDLPLKGSYVALRTNGIKLSFALEE